PARRGRGRCADSTRRGVIPMRSLVRLVRSLAHPTALRRRGFQPSLEELEDRCTPAAIFAEFPTLTSASGPFGITAGPDGALWFSEFTGNRIGRITTGGTVTEFVIPTAASGPQGITTGPDGALWFAEAVVNKIGRITTAGTITEFTVPTAGGRPFSIVSGPDG